MDGAGTRTWAAVGAMTVAAHAYASNAVTVKVTASVLEVQCTAEQRVRIRACAPGNQSMALAPFKSASIVGYEADASPIYRVDVDPGRQVLIKTILY